MSVAGKKILVGVTGGIAAYKIPSLVRLLTKAGAEVRVMMTASAKQFVTPLTLETVARHPVISDLWSEHEFVATRHIDWAVWPDLVLIAPASANFLGKAAHGLYDDFLTTVISATPAPVMISPAMNPEMWANQITQSNLAALSSLGWMVIEPDAGEMACDAVGLGRMPEPEALFDQVNHYFTLRAQLAPLAGKSILVTAGPCREAIDPVRYISNRSSGKMGYALAASAARSAARTTLVSGPTSLAAPSGVAVERVETTDQMFHVTATHFAHADCLIMAAAPADFQPTKIEPHKLKKNSGPLFTLSLAPTVDILSELSSRKTARQRLVGFALETENAIAEGRRKLASKKLDAIVVNSLEDNGAGFEHDTNKVTILTANHEVELPLLSKRETADRILEVVAGLF